MPPPMIAMRGGVRGGGHGRRMRSDLLLSRKREAYQMWRLGFQGQ